LYLKENKEEKTVVQTHSKKSEQSKRLMGWFDIVGLAAVLFGVFKLGIN